MTTERSFSVGIPISVFFLTLDRCLTIGLSLSYRAVHQKLLLACFCIVTTAAFLFTDFIYIALKFITHYKKPNPAGEHGIPLALRPGAPEELLPLKAIL